VQKLHLVGFTTEHDGLVFSARKGSKAGGYIIPLDKELLSTIAEAERLRNGDRGDKGEDGGTRPRRVDSRLTPREIQAHLRSGRSIPEVAAEAGVDVEWVERFAVPIVAEQAQMVERARAMTYSKARLGQSTRPLGTSVRWNLADKGVAISEEVFEEGWSAFQLQDEVWMIRFRYTSRARLQVAEWELDLGRNQLVSRNRLASELGYVEKGRRPPAIPAPPPRAVAAAPVRVVEEVIEEPEPEPEARPAPPPAPPRRRASARRTRRPPARKKSTAKKKPTAKKATARKATARKAAARKATVRKAAAKRPTAKKPTPKKSAKRATPKRASARRATSRAAAKKPVRKPAPKRPPAKTTPRRATPTATAAGRKAPRPTPESAAAPRPTVIKRADDPPTVAPPAPRLAATKARAERQREQRPVRAPVRPSARQPEPDVAPVQTDAPEARRPAPSGRTRQAGRPRIAAASAKEAASKRSGHGAVRKQPNARPATRPARPVRRRTQPARVQRQARKTAGAGDNASPTLSGPLARSLLARRLMARKSAQGDGGQQPRRPLRVR
jgi:hypothetical protein